MTHGSLFSGIGGFDLATAWVGWTNVFNCEIDPFNGSGTTRIVANKLGRNAIGFELNPKYIEIENRRRAQELGMFETINEYEGLSKPLVFTAS